LAVRRKQQQEKSFYERMQQDIRQRDEKTVTRRVSSVSPFRSETSTTLNTLVSMRRSRRAIDLQEHILNMSS
jgi:uncharacterized protein YqfB (UPF0267 family)